MTAPTADWIDLALGADTDVRRLAESVSLALWIDQAFLRRARLRFVPGSSASLEARLWFSPLCRTSGSLGITLVPAVAERLRAALAGRPGELDAVARFTAEARAGDDRPAAVLEQLLWSDVSTAAPDATRRLSGLRDALLDLDPARAARADDLGRWLLAQLPALPEGVRQRADVVLVAVAAAERLGVPCPLPVPRRIAAEAEGIRRRLRDEIDVGITLRTDGVHVSIPPRPGSRPVHATGRSSVELTLRAGPETGDEEGEPVSLTVWPGETTVPLTTWSVVGSASRAGRPGLLPGVQRLAGASLGQARQLWIAEDGGVVVRDRRGRDLVRLAVGGGARTVAALSGDGRRAAVGYGRMIYLVDVPASVGKTATVRELPQPERVVAVALDRTGDTLAAVVGGTLHVRWPAGEPYRSQVGGPVAGLWVHDGIVLVATGTDLVRHGPASPVRVTSWRPGSLAAIALDPDTHRVGWALGDGTLAVVDYLTLVSTRVGATPWRPTGLALGTELYAAGNTAEVLAFSPAGGPARSIPLGMYATGVLAQGDRLLVTGGGGPLVVDTADGARFLVRPDTGEAGETQALGDGLVLRLDQWFFEGGDAVSRAAGIADLVADLPGIIVLLGDAPAAPGDGRYPADDALPPGPAHAGEVVPIIGALHHRGVRVGVRLTGQVGDPEEVLRWLRLDIDAVFLEAAPRSEPDIIGLVRNAGRLLAVSGPSMSSFPDIVTALREVAAPPDSSVEIVRRFPQLPEEEDARLMAACAAIGAPGLADLPAADVLSLGPARLARLREFLAARGNRLTLQRGGSELLRQTGEVIAVLRSHGDDLVLCVANPYPEVRRVTLSWPTAFGRAIVPPGPGSVLRGDTLDLAGYDVAWYEVGQA